MYFIKHKKNETFTQHLESKSKWTFNKTSVHFGGLGWGGEGGGRPDTRDFKIQQRRRQRQRQKKQ